MNFKKLLPIIIIFLPLSGCWERDINKDLIQKIWKNVLKIHNLNPNMGIPEIAFLEKDLYKRLVRKDCSKYKKERRRKNCEEDRKDLENQVQVIFGRSYEELYKDYVKADRDSQKEDCSQYTDKPTAKQCRKDKKRIRNDEGIVFGRAFLSHNRTEIYPIEIYTYLSGWESYYERYNIFFTYADQEAYFYGVIAHEFHHLALYKLGIPVDGQHQYMLTSKAMEKSMNFISNYFNIPKNGIHQELTLRTLKYGAMEDRVGKRIKNRKNLRNNKK